MPLEPLFQLLPWFSHFKVMVKISKRPHKKPLTQVLAQELVETVEGDPGSHHLSLCLLGGFCPTPEPSPTEQAV